MTSPMILVQSFIATGMCNLDSTRFRDASLDSRKLGWTETWGGNDKEDPSTTTTSSNSWGGNNPNDWKPIEEEYISDLLASKHPQLPITLFQYRPAWLEQLVLSMAGIPFIVNNSSFASSEATGPLPYIRDLQPSKSPILVGRNHPTTSSSSPVAAANSSNNSILEYLHTYRGIDLDSHLLLDKKQKALAKCLTSLISTELSTILMFLRYEDLDAWQQVYRKQCTGGGIPTVGGRDGTTWLSTIFGPFQAWSERALARRKLGDARTTQTIEQAIAQSRQAYEALETQLLLEEQNLNDDGKNSSSPFLLGTSKPSMVDALLWDHLANALCDVHLVVVLSSFPRLINYFQNIYNTYFADNVSPKADEVWYKWNQMQNKQNQFQQLPLMTSTSSRWSSSSNQKPQFKDAIELMQSLSARRHDLQELLTVAQQKRLAEPWPEDKSASDRSNFYRWRMGDDFKTRTSGDDEDGATSRENPLRKKLQQEQMHNDQVWITGVVGVSALAVLLLGTMQSTK